ncbi:hypothetical protein FGB62_280g02 [Gracilaria domingensis]|nr:hypothetical protein FGB62_280g02 [Gracilaria domingensis]
MSDDNDTIPTTLLFCPLVLLNGDDDGEHNEQEIRLNEQDAGNASDLFVYKGRLTTLPREQDPVSPASLSSKSAKHFFCPVCDHRVKVTAEKIFCTSCNWNAMEAGIHSVSELLQSEADPYSLLSQRFEELVKIVRGELREEDLHEVNSIPTTENEALFGPFRMEDLIERRMQKDRLFRKKEPARRRLASSGVEILHGKAENAETVLPKLQVDLCGAEAVVQLQNARVEDVTVLVCAAGEDDGQALTLGADVIGEARICIADGAIRRERDGGCG